LEQAEQELKSHIKSFWKRPGIGSGVDIIQMQMHFISGFPWMPNFGSNGGPTTGHLPFSTDKQTPTVEPTFFFSKQCSKRLGESIIMLNPSSQTNHDALLASNINLDF
jgi:hypothetical protein